MNRHIPHPSSKDALKHQQYSKQQQQLREFGFMKSNSQSKVLSADSMIEDLLSKKETFQKRNPESLQNQEVALPVWLSKTPPPLFERVWRSVETTGGLADTPLLSSVLLTSNLSTDTLGYIWSLANRTVPGALTQSEVYLVLALVGLAQAGYVVNNLSALHQVPQAPIPSLDLSLLSARQPQVYPNTLNVTNLPDPLSVSWASPETINASYSGQIDVSYVSSGPMVSSNLISDKTSKSSTNMKFPGDSNVSKSLSFQNNIVPENAKLDLGVVTKAKSDTKRSENTHSFSFPKLNDSPSHIVNAIEENTDSFDDEFTEFQSADFSTISESQEVQKNSDSTIYEDEFTQFQNASSDYNGDDLSVLVIGGKHIPSAQQLWVTDNPSVPSKGKDETGDIFNGFHLPNDDKTGSENQPNVSKRKSSIETKYDVFQVFQEVNDKYSVFHNPLPDEDDKQHIISDGTLENMQMETKSIFQHSLFEDPDPALDLFKSGVQTTNLKLPNPQPTQSSSDKKEQGDEDDEEYSNFQNFPVEFPENNSVASSENIDKYDVFRTIVFEDQSPKESAFQPITINNTENISQVQQFELGIDEYQKGDQYKIFSDSPETKSVDSIHFGDIQEPVLPSDSSNVGSLFSSLVISERSEIENNSELSSELGHVEDKYKALRLLEPSTDEVDEFGEFLGADLPNSENDPRKSKDPTSIQIRCLEACLQLLKDALSKMSQCSTPEIVSEVLSDARANTYFDCLLEVHRVSQRIISQLNSDLCLSVIAELRETWDSLALYFKHSEHTHMVESVGPVCGVCRSNTGPSPITFGAQTFHSPCANLYLHCVEPVLPNIAPALVQ